MPITNAKPIPIVPVGVTDSVDGTTGPQGSMSALSNLVNDPSTKNMFVPRPAAIRLTDFSDSGFTDPAFVSCVFVVGDLCYGMIATADNTGQDMPFVYDLGAGAFITVSGATAMNTPNSPNTTGTWTPPTMALIGTFVVVTHPGFNGGANKIGWFDISTPATPAWDAGDTATNGLPNVPVAVFNFSGRAYYAVDNTVWFSDVLDPLTITNATNVITMGDTTPVIALSGLPLLTTAGGIVQSMIAFKNATLFQVTGDLALMNLTSAAIDAGVGTYCPLSVTPTNSGLAFISPYGLRTISQSGTVSPVIGGNGQGISVPFINSTVPSRVCAAFNVDTFRATTQNGNVPSLPIQEWWYNSDLTSWTGPHTFPASLIQRWRASFILTPVGVNASLWRSDTQPVETSLYVENGTQLSFGYSPSLLPLTGGMNLNAVVETSVGVQFSQTGGTLNFIALDENGNVLDTTTKTVNVTASFWNQFAWGFALWGGTVLDYQQIKIPWTQPIVFNQMFFVVNGNAVKGFKIGTGWFRYQPLGYMVQ